MLAVLHDGITLSMVILGLAVAVDMALGELPSGVHPTVWMGKAVSILKSRARRGKPALERFQGALLALSVIALFAVPAYVGLSALRSSVHFIVYVVIAAILLKTTFAVRSMKEFTLPIASAAEEGDYQKARRLLRHVVRRDPSGLSEEQVLSAAVETIAEGTVDGVTSALFYYALFGVPGAIAARAINTLDSILGYRDSEHVHIGWFSAELDTLTNYIPARLTGLLTALAAKFSGEDWRNSLKILFRDSGRTESLNAGWPMAAMAGALKVRLEKPGFYELGDPNRPLKPDDIRKALRIMKMNTLLFLVLVNTPLVYLLSKVS